MKRYLVGLSVSSVVLAMIFLASGCSSDSGPRKNDAAATGGNLPQGSGGQIGSGGIAATGGQVGSGGSLMTGGTVAAGGIAATGGALASGGSPATGGTATSRGTIGTGGAISTGGFASGGKIGVGGTQSGGTSATGGMLATGGTVATGGMLATGGTVATGGTTATGGIPGSGGNLGTGGARVDAGGTQGCQCTQDGTFWSVPFDCYCADRPSECEINYASYRPDAGAGGGSYTGIKEYAGCNLAVVYDMYPGQSGNKYFDLTTGRLVGLSKTVDGGIACPFGGNDAGLVFFLGTGQTTVPASCTRTACFATSREPSYCSN